MNFKESEKRLLRNSLIYVAIVLLFINTGFAFGLAPLKAYLAADKTFGFDYLPDIVDAVSRIIQLISFIVCYAVTIYTIYRFSLRKSVPVIVASCALTVYKYGANLLAGWFIFDGVPRAADMALQIWAVVLNASIELIIYGIVVLITYRVKNKTNHIYELQKKNYEKSTGETFERRNFVFPFKGFHNKLNPLQHSAYLSAAVLIAFAVGSRLISDIFIGGFPTDIIDALWMIAYYGADVVLNIIAYLLMLVVMSNLDTHDLKLRIKYDT